MAAATIAPDTTRTLAELVDDLGGIPLHRILMRPHPGEATEADVIAIQERENRLCELIDGVLVEKTMGLRESCLAAVLIGLLRAFVAPRQLGIVTAPDGAMRLFPGQVRIPDVAFVSGKRLPGGRMPREPIPDLVPDLAIEVLSESNSKAEMARKRVDYFGSGVLAVWEVDPESRTVAVFDSPDRFTTLNVADTLEGAPVLPGFLLPIRDLFGELDFQDPATPAS